MSDPSVTPDPRVILPPNTPDAAEIPEPAEIPDPAVIVLMGASASGKSTWAAAHYRTVEIVSADALRGIVGSSPVDQTASGDAFAVLDQILAARSKRRLTTVVDSTALRRKIRMGFLAAAREVGLPAVLVVMDPPPALVRARNAARERKVPESVVDAQLAQLTLALERVTTEGWDLIVRGGGDDGDPAAAAATGVPATPSRAQVRVTEPDRSPPQEVQAPSRPRPGLRVVLQVSRFPADVELAGWLRDVALTADRIGFDGIALMDHLIQIPQVGRAWDPIPAPWTTLGMLAGLATDLRLGSLVSPVTLHHPGVLAKTVATLDVLSGGRAFCGLGAGWWEREHRGYGVPFPPARERLDQLETTIETMRALWAPGTKPYRGRRVELPETTCYPRPLDRIPILVGGSGERRTLRIAAELADGCNLPADLGTLPGRIEVLHRHCAAVGRDPQEVEVTVLDVPVVGRDREDTARRVERLRGRSTTADFAARHHAGTVDRHARRYAELARLGVGTVFLALPDLAGAEDLERCRPLVAAAQDLTVASR